VLPRFFEIAPDTFIPLESVIARHLDTLFPGMEILHSSVFRVTRDADFTVSDEADDLLRAVEDELRRRRFGEVVRLEVSSDMEPRVREALIDWLEMDEVEVVDVDGLVVLGPVDVVRLTSGRPGRRVVVESWGFPDGSGIVELSAKCRPARSARTAAVVRDLITVRGIPLAPTQETKTQTSLQRLTTQADLADSAAS
jgi:hypothetical protein